MVLLIKCVGWLRTSLAYCRECGQPRVSCEVASLKYPHKLPSVGRAIRQWWDFKWCLGLPETLASHVGEQLRVRVDRGPETQRFRSNESSSEIWSHNLKKGYLHDKPAKKVWEKICDVIWVSDSAYIRSFSWYEAYPVNTRSDYL